MGNGTLYLTAEEAARILGVSVATLYAYVSRKLIRSEPIEGSRARKYWKADVDRLRGKPGPRNDANPQAPLVSESAITLITEGGLYFRGRDAVELSRHATIEALAAMMWETDEELLFGSPVTSAPDVWPQIQPSIAGLGVFERALVLFPILERVDPRAYDLSPAGYARTGADVLRWYAAVMVRSNKLPTQSLHKFVAKAMRAPAGFDEVIRTLLILSADHEFDPITYAVRAVANVGVTPYQAVTAGIMVSRGQRFQEERFGAASRFLKEILASKDGHKVVVQRLRNREPLPGFSSGRRPSDPRPAALMVALRRVLHRDSQFMRLEEAEKAASEAVGAIMEFIMPALFVGYRLGFVGEELAIAALGRTVGWIAHSLEQFHQHELIRPRASYVGTLPT
jgi:citrate synthase